ncbi:fimbria/pilus outer membrane usher protein [Klebsiella indica]|uniref:fimbria/pilus outer membrane usher protein n=1 Tax=Klebsiella TaxID=570 RepID=UPI0031B6B7C5
MKKKTKKCFPFLLTLSGIIFSSSVFGEEFNMQFVHGDGNVAVAKQVSQGQAFQQGTYPLDIFLNNQLIDSLPVTFVHNGENGRVEPCFTGEQLYNYGIIIPAPLDSKKCVNINKIFPSSRVAVDAGRQRIDLTVPQENLRVVPKGSIPSRLWDNGINADFINYNISYTDNSNKTNSIYSNEKYSYISLENGLNLGRWRFRQNGFFTHSSSNGSRWRNLASWAETDIQSVRGRLIVGQASTSNTVFDSFQFRGVQLSSVDDMLPDSMRNYAPIVRGVASSNARVTIRQNGYIVYSTNVPPGPFTIRDVYPNTSGDLFVTVSEADGSERNFTVAYSSISHMLREGIWSYQVTAGRYHNGLSGYEPQFLQGTFSRGISHELTPFAGMMIANNYQSSVIGIGTNLGEIGALSFDGSYARTDLASGGTKNGASFRLLYAKSLNSLGTDFRLAGYRYSTSGYYDFSDAVQERRDWDNGIYRHEYIDPNNIAEGTPVWDYTNNSVYYSSRYGNKRSKMELSVNQSLKDYGRVFANMSQLTYWGTSEKSRTIQLGFNSSYKRLSYSVYYQSTRSQYGYSDNSVNLTLSIPFFWNDDKNIIASTTQFNHDQKTGDSYTTGISGTLLDDGRLSYGISTGHNETSNQTSSANLAYQGSMGNVSSSYSYNKNYKQKTVDLSGGIVAHSGGITLSQPLGDTFALIHADNAAGTSVLNAPGVRIDPFGYAVVNNVSPYRYNTIALNTEDLSPGLDIPQATIQTVPTQKAIVGINFETYYGHSLLIHTKMNNGLYPNIGATVFNEKRRSSGTVGMNGDAYVSGIKSGEKLTVKWGDEPLEQCQIKVPENLSPQTKGQGYQELTLVCQQPSGD